MFLLVWHCPFFHLLSHNMSFVQILLLTACQKNVVYFKLFHSLSFNHFFSTRMIFHAFNRRAEFKEVLLLKRCAQVVKLNVFIMRGAQDSGLLGTSAVLLCMSVLKSLHKSETHNPLLVSGTMPLTCYQNTLSSATTFSHKSDSITMNFHNRFHVFLQAEITECSFAWKISGNKRLPAEICCSAESAPRLQLSGGWQPV